MSHTKKQPDREGVRARLGGCATNLLIALFKRADEVVTNHDLFELVRLSIFVGDSNLTVHIAALRKAIDHSHSGEWYMLNVAAREYRFTAPSSTWRVAGWDRQSVAITDGSMLGGVGCRGLR
jgi:DNA-binding winged helix-turn-helix (wHTH) protein